MLSEKEVGLLYETLLSAPGMDETVKVDLRMPRKTVLLLVKVIERGLQTKPEESLDALMLAAGGNSAEVLQQAGKDMLQKSGLSAMSEKLESLQPKKKS